MMPYATKDFYTSYSGEIPPEDVEKTLLKASRHIDSLTYNRIPGRGFDNLTEFQKTVVSECCCELADFEYDNSEYINSILQEYTVNGVTMKFGESWSVVVRNGVVIRRDVYDLLSQSGLCNRNLR